MTKRVGSYNPKLVNRYVPDMAYSAEVISEGPDVVSFGAPAIASTTAVAATTLIVSNTAYTATIALTTAIDAAFGRCLTYTADAANTRLGTARGRDYLGQPVTETPTMNGNSTVQGNKAFKWVDSFGLNAANGASNVSVGTSDKLGLPYKATNVLSEEANGVRVSTLGSLVAGAATNPQTATSNDPRGTYDPQTTLDGTTTITATFLFDPSNLHGYAHYGA